MSDPLNHLRSICYYSEPLEVPYSPNQFLGWDIFAVSYSKPALDLSLVCNNQYTHTYGNIRKRIMARPRFKVVNGDHSTNRG